MKSFRNISRTHTFLYVATSNISMFISCGEVMVIQIYIFYFSIHLFFMFPNIEEGGLTTYRTAIVQNQHLAVLAEVKSNISIESNTIYTYVKGTLKQKLFTKNERILFNMCSHVFLFFFRSWSCISSCSMLMVQICAVTKSWHMPWLTVLKL